MAQIDNAAMWKKCGNVGVENGSMAQLLNRYCGNVDEMR